MKQFFRGIELNEECDIEMVDESGVWGVKMSGSGRMEGLSCSASMTPKSVMHVTQELG